jgi:hypothetical protein
MGNGPDSQLQVQIHRSAFQSRLSVGRKLWLTRQTINAIETDEYDPHLTLAEQSWVSWITPSITAVRCFETLTTNRPDSSSSARR